MSDLVKALQIFLKYGDPHSPTTCTHDYLIVHGYPRDTISPEDTKALEALGFEWDDEFGGWSSTRFGSC